MAYADLDDVKNFLGDANVDPDQVQLLLENASNAVDMLVGRPIGMAVRTDYMNGDDEPVVWLHWPTRWVVHVKLDGETLNKAAYRWRFNGGLWRASGAWPFYGHLEVKYKCGYGEDSPEYGVARAAVLQAVADLASNPDRLSQETIGDWSRSWSVKQMADFMLAGGAEKRLKPLMSRRPMA